MTAAELGRIRWHCRRGLLELDLILEEFQRRHLAGLDHEQLERFKELLAFPDNDLLDAIMGRTPSPDQRFDRVLSVLRTSMEPAS